MKGKLLVLVCVLVLAGEKIVALDFYTSAGKEFDSLHSPRQEDLGFTAQDLYNVGGFVSVLEAQGDPVSEYVLQALGKETRKALQSLTQEQRDRKQSKVMQHAKEKLAQSLTQMLDAKDFYTAERFQGISLSKKTQALIQENPSPTQLRHLNSALLQELYPSTIRGWYFSGEGQPDDSSLYTEQKKTYWEKRIDPGESPYPHIEEQKESASVSKALTLELRLGEELLTLKLHAELTPQSTGTRYHYNITEPTQLQNSALQIIHLDIDGQKISSRIHFSLRGTFKDTQGNDTGTLRGALAFKLNDDSLLSSHCALFLRVLLPHPQYIRIRGKVTGTLKSARLDAEAFDGNGSFIKSITGSINELQKIILTS